MGLPGDIQQDDLEPPVPSALDQLPRTTKNKKSATCKEQKFIIRMIQFCRNSGPVCRFWAV